MTDWSDTALDLAEHSPHAVELLDAHERVGAAESAEHQETSDVRAAPQETGAGATRCTDLATALAAAVVGLEQDLGDATALRHLFTELVRTSIDGLIAQAGSAQVSSSCRWATTSRTRRPGSSRRHRAATVVR